jgi:L-fucose isomerase-like protein
VADPAVMRNLDAQAGAAENLRHVHLYPHGFYFPAGGASVHHLAAAGDFTFARLTRAEGRYRMHVLRGALEQFDAETNERLMRASSYERPRRARRLRPPPGGEDRMVVRSDPRDGGGTVAVPPTPSHGDP